jgi:WD40 repeat protein
MKLTTNEKLLLASGSNSYVSFHYCLTRQILSLPFFLWRLGQEKKISIFDIATGKLLRTSPTESEGGEVVKMELDPSGQFLATSSQDRYIRLYQFDTGEMIAKVINFSISFLLPLRLCNCVIV